MILKKTAKKENIFDGENETKLLDGELPFKIVKFEKSLNPEDYLTKETPLKILTSVLIDSLNVKSLRFTQKTVGSGSFFRSIENHNIFISEGDTINIKSNIETKKIKPPINNIKEIFDIELSNFIFSNTNFNFTFLIELDPL